MYIVLSDPNAIDAKRECLLSKGDYFKRVAAIFPKYKDYFPDDIEGILIYSIRNEHSMIKAKIAHCEDYQPTDDYIKIDYSGFEETDATCGEIRKRLYWYIKNHNLMVDNFTPVIVFVESYRDYIFLLTGRNEKIIKNRSFFDKIEEFRIKNEWDKIIDSFPSEHEIEQSVYWEDDACLGTLSFALAKKAEKSTKKMNQEEKKQRQEYENYYLKIIQRCMDLDPNTSKYKSSLAYFYYNSYIENNKDKVFQKAVPIFEDLIETSREKYKELYRYTTMRRYNLDANQEKYTGEWFKYLDCIINDYCALIKGYEELDDERKKKYKKI